jgi:hypothetical protein
MAHRNRSNRMVTQRPIRALVRSIRLGIGDGFG